MQAATLEANSEHPFGQSILNYAAEIGISPATVERAEAVPGKGVYVTQEGDAILPVTVRC